MTLDHDIELTRARSVSYTDIGPRDGDVVFYFHGAPSCRLDLVGLQDAFSDQAVRVISPDRPGYGRSTPFPGRRLEDWPADVDALAAALDVERYLVLGISSGGPYAVACAALGQRVTGAIVVAGVTDFAWDGFRPYFGQLDAVADAPTEEEGVAVATELYGPGGDAFWTNNDYELAEVDLEYLKRSGPNPLAGAAGPFHQGVAGFAQDVWLEGRPWTFDPAAISVPVNVYCGSQDGDWAHRHSRHTADLIPQATFEELSSHGHLSIVTEFPRFIRAILDS